MRYREIFETLASLLKISKQVPEHHKRDFVRAGCLETITAGKLSLDSVIPEIEMRTADYLRRHQKKFVLVTTLSIKWPSPIKRLTHNDARIVISESVPRKFNRLHVQEKSLLPSVPPTTYSFVQISVTARCEHSAAEKALRSLDIVRALWNLYFNRRKTWRITTARPNPVNGIVLGPFHTIHLPDGSAPTDLYWWEPSYIKESQPLDLTSEGQNIRKAERWLKSLFQNSPLRGFAEQALLRYVRALDAPDIKSSFLQLWSVLEYLTCTEKMGYERTIARALFVFKDKDYHQAILNRLRNERNQLVHEGRDSDQTELSLYNLLLYANESLMTLIQVAHQFENTQDFAVFLDLPSDSSALEQRGRALNRQVDAVRYAKKIFAGPIS